MKEKNVNYLEKDDLGSTRVILNNNNEVVSTYDYDVFGNQTDNEVSEGTPYLYTGQEFDEETGLHNFQARFYDSVLMRFYAVDPEEQFASPYLYCGNNPILYIDPDGCKIVADDTVSDKWIDKISDILNKIFKDNCTFNQETRTFELNPEYKLDNSASDKVKTLYECLTSEEKIVLSEYRYIHTIPVIGEAYAVSGVGNDGVGYTNMVFNDVLNGFENHASRQIVVHALIEGLKGAQIAERTLKPGEKGYFRDSGEWGKGAHQESLDAGTNVPGKIVREGNKVYICDSENRITRTFDTTRWKFIRTK